MAYYNHFTGRKYKQIRFNDVPIRGRFRSDFFNGKRRRKDIICVRTGELTYKEEKSGKERSYHHIDDNTMVYSFSERALANCG